MMKIIKTYLKIFLEKDNLEPNDVYQIPSINNLFDTLKIESLVVEYKISKI